MLLFCKCAFLSWMVCALMLIYMMINRSMPIVALVESKDDNVKHHPDIEKLSSKGDASSNIHGGNMSFCGSSHQRMNMRILSSNIFKDRKKNPREHYNHDMSLALRKTEADFLEWVRYVADKKHEDAEEEEDIYDADQDVRSQNVSKRVIRVSKTDQKADFASVQAAVDSIPSHNSQRVTIQIDAGVYEEKVEVPASKAYVTFWGGGSDATMITWHDTASSAGSTFQSATVAVNSKSFIARDVSFQNSAPAPPPGAKGKQAVALRISGDKAAFYNCNFYGAQDTLYDHAGRHYFQSCFIEGSIDFIFGDGLSLYEHCQLKSIATKFGSLTAQRRQKPSENTGFSFVDCKVTGSGMIYLGRAWGPYSRVVFITTYMDDIIVPTGWDDWGNSDNEKTAFYGEYNCFGPGSNSKNRVAWSYQLTTTQASPFQSLSFVDGASWVQT